MVKLFSIIFILSASTVTFTVLVKNHMIFEEIDASHATSSTESNAGPPSSLPMPEAEVPLALGLAVLVMKKLLARK